jgi:hypothetical protein
MSKPSRSIFGVALLAVGLAAGVLLHARADTQEKAKEKAPAGDVKWEYRIVVLSGRTVGFGPKGGQGDASSVEKELNELGEAGFELAFVTATTQSAPSRGNLGARREFGGQGDAGQLISVVYYTLKRAKK